MHPSPQLTPTGAAAALLLVAALLLTPGAEAQPVPSPSPEPEPGSELLVYLLTMGPGDAVWERFGHNALRVVDTFAGTDVSYNWGIFDFQQEDFIPRFLRGEMLYSMAPFPTERMVASYVRSDRSVVLQELNLTPSQRAALRDYAEWNSLPENRDYRYDYFLDNCSTRVRDVLDRVLGGFLRDEFAHAPTGTSYRTHTRRLTAVDPFVFTGMDLLLGSPGDRPISVWEEMFLPMTLRDAARRTTVPREDGREVPLVLREEILYQAARPLEPLRPPVWLHWYLLLGSAAGVALAWLGRRAGTALRGGTPSAGSRLALGVAGTIWSLLAAVAGIILVGVLFTDHHFMYRNENLLHGNPISLLVALLLPASMVGGRVAPLLRRAAWLVVGLSTLGLFLKLLPWSVQGNGILIALALPVHLGLAVALSSLPAMHGREGDPAGG